MKLCELRISDIASVKSITEALCTNGYTVQTAVQWKRFPEKGIEYFCISVFNELPAEGE